MVSKIKRIITKALGWALLILGIIGLFLPVLQGILFLLIGLYFLSHETPWAARLFNRIKKRYPAINNKFEALRLKNKNRFKKLSKRA